jgi:hypothetical protein
MAREISTKILLVLALFICSHIAVAQKRSISYGNPSPSGISLGAYEPKTFKSLDALPENIRSKVEDHLRARFGSEFYSQLVFVGGAAIDVAEFLRVNPNTKWKLHSYELVYKYANKKSGLKEYYARIRLDSNGDVVDEIDLPDVAKYPQKANLISVDRAVEIAKSHGFKPKKMSIKIRYDEDAGSLSWVINSLAFEDIYTITRRVLKIDAHNGVILKDGLEGGIK